MAGPSPLQTRFTPDVLKALVGLQFKARYVVEGYLSGINKSPFHGYSSEFREYRDYQPGDDLRRLDWRLYARADRLCIRRFEEETNLDFYLVLDTSKSMIYQGERSWCSKLDYCSLIAASITWILLKQKDSAGLLSMQMEELNPRWAVTGAPPPSHELYFLKASQKSTQLGTIFRHCERVTPSPTPSLAFLLNHAQRLIRRRSVILLLTDLLDPADAIQDHLKKLRFQGHEVLVFHVLDPDEQDFGFKGSSIFEDLESGQRRRISPQQVRSLYLERINRFFDDYRSFFEAQQIDYTLLPSSEPPSQALGYFLNQRRLFT